MIASGYGTLAYELETIPCGRLGAGSEFNPHAAESEKEQLSKLFQEVADASIDPASMTRVDNDMLLNAILKDGGILHVRNDPRLQEYRRSFNGYRTQSMVVAETPLPATPLPVSPPVPAPALTIVKALHPIRTWQLLPIRLP
eukprot:gene15445-2059_t